MTTTRVSKRREILTYDGYIGVFVDDIQVAAAVRQDEEYAARNGGAQWALWSSGLRVPSSVHVDGLQHPQGPNESHPLPLRTEADARAWLSLIADLAEHGPTIIDINRRTR